MDESIRVLHVDDDADFAELASAFLERADDRFVVETATGADGGLDRLAAAEFDCVVSDYEMPGRNGIEFLEAVRQDHPDLPFVLYTGRGSEEIASEAISAGVTDYIQKEIGTDQYTVLANRVANAVEAYRTRRQVARHERINSLIRGISRQLVEADTTDAIERTVCEAVAESEPYRFAWIGEPDPDTGTIVPRTSAGDADGYLEEVTIRHDDSPEAQGPAGRAVRNREVQVAQHIPDDPSFEPWRDTVDEYGHQSVVVLPLTRDDVLHGILVIYSDQPYAFDDAEQEVLVELADTIGEALGAAETRQRLEERERELARQQSLLKAQQEAVIDGMLVVDDAGEFISCNERFVELWDAPDDVADAHGRMQTLIDDLLTFAREGRQVGDVETVRLGDVATECWRTVATPGATLVVKTDGTVQANPNRLRQILQNLFRNSVEHSSTGSRAEPGDSVEHGSTSNRTESGDSVDHASTGSRPGADGGDDGDVDVTVTVGVLDDGFYVEDDGAGILKSEREDVFESGYSTSETGTGFGLSIVEQMVETHGWTIRVTDGTEGGARFDITDVEVGR